MSDRRPTPRVSRQRYLVRRIGVLVMLVLLGGSAALVLGALGGDDGPETLVGGDAAPGDSPSTTTGDTSSDAPEPEPGDPDPTTSDAPAAPMERAGPPTPAEPARVLIVGDSDAGTFGPYLQQLLSATGIVETELDYKVSSGLARPDFYDWHAALEQAVPSFDPDIVVVTFGGNDAQFLADRSGATVVGQPRPDADNSAWTAEYRDRVAQVVDYLDQDGRTVVWVGIPNHANPEVTFRMRHQDEAVKAELAERPEIRFVDTWTRFAGRNGGFAQFVIDPRDGEGKSVRASDGFHLNQTGAEILAIDISMVIFDELRALGAQI